MSEFHFEDSFRTEDDVRKDFDNEISSLKSKIQNHSVREEINSGNIGIDFPQGGELAGIRQYGDLCASLVSHIDTYNKLFPEWKDKYGKTRDWCEDIIWKLDRFYNNHMSLLTYAIRGLNFHSDRTWMRDNFDEGTIISRDLTVQNNEE